jgi:1-deoxy-D-xylulose-5-phosphate synthase
VPDAFRGIEIGRAAILREGREVQIWALGDMIGPALEAASQLAAKGIGAGVVNARFIRPLDEQLLARQMGEARVVATMENGMADGGFGSGVEAFLVGKAYRGRVLRFGWPDRFIPHGAPEVLRERYGLTANAVASAIVSALPSAGA